MKNDYLKLAVILRNKRLERGYSVRGLSRAVGISDTELTRIENGERQNYNLITLIALCKVLKLDFIKLLQVTNYLPEYFDYLPDSQFDDRDYYNLIRRTNLKNEYRKHDLKPCPFCEVCIMGIDDLNEVLKK